jgi:hypothetical protein
MIARVWVNVRLLWSHPLPALHLFVGLTFAVLSWRHGFSTDVRFFSLFPVYFISVGIAAVQKDVLRSSFGFVLPAHQSVLRIVLLGLAMLSGSYLVEVAHNAAWDAVAPGSRLPDLAFFALGAGLSVLTVLETIAAGDRAGSLMVYCVTLAGGYTIGWIAAHPSVGLLFGTASIASAWYLLEGRTLGRWVRRKPSAGLPVGLRGSVSRAEATRYQEAIVARRPYEERIWMTALLAWMHSPTRSPSLRAIAGDAIERFGRIQPLRGLFGGLGFLVISGYAFGDPQVTLPAWVRGAPAWMVAMLFWVGFALPRSRLITALPLGRRVLFATQVMRNLLAAIVAVLLFEGFDLLSAALAPHMPILSGHRFAPVGHSAQLAATVASIGLVPPLLKGRVANFMAGACIGLAWLGLVYYVVAPGLLAGSALCAATWGFGLVVLRDRSRRGSLV